MNISRRGFLKSTTAIGTGLLASPSLLGYSATTGYGRQITITDVDSNFEREPLIRPFGFKGGYMHEIWQTAVMVQS